MMGQGFDGSFERRETELLMMFVCLFVLSLCVFALSRSSVSRCVCLLVLVCAFPYMVVLLNGDVIRDVSWAILTVIAPRPLVC